MNVEDLKAQVGSAREVMARHGFHPRYPLCPNPAHDDRRSGSVWFYVASDGDERVRCAACGLDEDGLGLARLLGESIPTGATRSRPHKRRIRVPRQTIDRLSVREALPLEWAVARLIACLSEWEGHTELARNLLWLRAQGADTSMICRLAGKLRELVRERFGVPPIAGRTDDGELILGRWPLRTIDAVVESFEPLILESAAKKGMVA